VACWNSHLKNFLTSYMIECRAVPVATKGVDSIMEYTLSDMPYFDNLDALTEQLEKGTLAFISDIEKFLYKHQK
jgi:hypothetical protein